MHRKIRIVRKSGTRCWIEMDFGGKWVRRKTIHCGMGTDPILENDRAIMGQYVGVQANFWERGRKVRKIKYFEI